MIQPSREIYDLDNNASLRSKIQLFNESEVEIALELHLNGGGGDYSTAIFWNDPETAAFSDRGCQIAIAICEQFAAGLPWKSIGARAQSYFQRSLAFLNRTTMPAVIIEPAFKD